MINLDRWFIQLYFILNLIITLEGSKGWYSLSEEWGLWKLFISTPFQMLSNQVWSVCKRQTCKEEKKILSWKTKNFKWRVGEFLICCYTQSTNACHVMTTLLKLLLTISLNFRKDEKTVMWSSNDFKNLAPLMCIKFYSLCVLLDAF